MLKIRLVKSSNEPTLKTIRNSITTEQIRDRIDRQSKNEAEFLLLEADGSPVSFIFLKWNGKQTHPEYPDMEDLYTKESERSKGYGSMLIAECERLSKQKGFKKIGLAVNPTENENALKLYEKLGYKHDGKESYVDGVYNGVEDWCIDLEKELK